MTDLSKIYIHTANGRKYFPFAPTVEMVDIEVIAHHLATIGRWNGATQHRLWADRIFYCPTEEQHILTADLKWVSAGDLVEGDKLLGFDEKPTAKGDANVAHREFKGARVEVTCRVKRKIVRLEMSDGSTIRASEEHPWLVRAYASGNQKWKTAAQIRDEVGAGRRIYINRFIEPWSYTASRDAGYLAGIFDGECSYSFSGRRGGIISVSQNPGPVHDAIVRILKDLGFNHSILAPTGNVNHSSHQMQVQGGWREHLRLLGSVRPERLVRRFCNALNDGSFVKRMNAPGEPLQIIKAWDEGEEWVAGLETSTHTYICEGYGAHNSVAEHSVYVADYLEREMGRPDLALQGLLHDAPEYVVGDVIRPLKRSPVFHAPFKALEEKNEAVINAAFGLPFPLAPEVKIADEAVCEAEAQQIVPKDPREEWSSGLCHDNRRCASVVIQMLSPYDAKWFFLDRYAELMSRQREAAE